jgi:Periplasmic binding protein
VRNRLRIVSVLAGVTAIVMAAGGGVANGSSGTRAASAATREKLTATDVGITPKELHVAIVADVDNPIRPGLNKQVADAINAWGVQVNKRGGLAGRKVVVDFYDSKLNPDESTNAFIQACDNDLAMVGTTAFAALNGDAIGSCKDKTGAAIGIPNLSGSDIGAGTGSQKTSFPLVKVGAQDFSKATPTYNVGVGPGSYIKNKVLHGNHVKQMAVLPAGVPGVQQLVDQLNKGGEQAGTIDEIVPPVSIADTAPQAQFTPIIDKIKRENINVVQLISDVAGGKLLKEAQVQGLDLTKVIFVCPAQCTSPGFLQTASNAANGSYVYSFVTPSSETAVPGVKEYVKAVGKDNVSANAELAYAAALNFESLVNRIVKRDGPNAVTRASLLKEIRTDPSVAAKGITAPNAKIGVASGCYMMLKVNQGRFTRAHPAKAGTFDCDKKNLTIVTG